MINSNPRIHIVRQGNLANQMIQYLVAKHIQRAVPNSYITGSYIPLWNIKDTCNAPVPTRNRVYDWHEIPMEETIYNLNSKSIDAVVLSGYFQRLSYFPSLSDSRNIFPPIPGKGRAFDEKHLVISIRANEILSGHWPNYTLIPLQFYKQIIEDTGLLPVFTGQISAGPYREMLDKAFPRAIFYQSPGVQEDFETLRLSKNILLSVSTFSWLAAWLSHANIIIMPMTGFYNPFQDRDVKLLCPLDNRYRYHLFPINYAVPFEDLSLAHDPIIGKWKQINPDMLQRMLLQYPRFGKCLPTQYKDFFDEVFYLSEYPDVANAVRSGHIASAFTHFLEYGFHEGRSAFRANWEWYSRTYPLAASEVGAGDFWSLADHFITIGHVRGYRPYPE